MRADELALLRGWDDTKATLRAWNRDPLRVLGPWSAASLGIAALLLAGTWLAAAHALPDPTPTILPGLDRPATAADYRTVLVRNGLVLALHALACVAGFMAGSSLPQVARSYTGWRRTLHEAAGPLAIAFVVAATAFSLITQAHVLGEAAATEAHRLGVAPAVLLAGLLPHALPELYALFLPLAAWTLASRRGAWNELLAATFATVAVAVPLLLASAAVETWVTPHVLAALAG